MTNAQIVPAKMFNLYIAFTYLLCYNKKAIQTKLKFVYNLSFKFTAEDIRLFAKITNTELVMIDGKTDINSFEQQLELLDATAALKR